ncbi:hypothetical protein ACROYT_G011992 [Oculina patagonica]
MDLLSQRIELQGFEKCYEPEGDGDCFYKAAAFQLGRNGSDLKNSIFDYLAQNQYDDTPDSYVKVIAPPQQHGTPRYGLYFGHTGNHYFALKAKISSPQRLANPTPSSVSYLFLYRSLHCLSPKLLVTDSSRPPNPQDVPQALIDEHLQLLLQSLGQPPIQVSEP